MDFTNRIRRKGEEDLKRNNCNRSLFLFVFSSKELPTLISPSYGTLVWHLTILEMHAIQKKKTQQKRHQTLVDMAEPLVASLFSSSWKMWHDSWRKNGYSDIMVSERPSEILPGKETRDRELWVEYWESRDTTWLLNGLIGHGFTFSKV